MKIFSGQASPVQLQWLLWGFVFLINFISMLPMDGAGQAAVFTVISTFFYAVIIYGNLLFLLPVFYKKGRVPLYALASVIFLGIIGVTRTYFSQYMYNRFFAKEYTPVTVKTIIYVSAACVVVYVLSFVFRFALEYFKLKRQAEEIIAEKSLAELNLLKSQVQPHFLFNTLNNIYYEAYKEAPRTAMFIERLSEIMRYFVDESPREEVTLGTEIQFLENYIALERIRIRHDISITFIQHCRKEAGIPPMLLMTFVENIFKHGINKANRENAVTISLVQENGFLLFQTQNLLHDRQTVINGQSGFGIRNLRKRLTLLFGDNYELTAQPAGKYFNASLKIPLP